VESLYPLIFEPRFKERVWGGRRLETLYGKRLPPRVPIGESWEIADRPGDESIISNGPFAGRTLRWLMQEYERDVLGDAAPAEGHRFPLLCKILDARDRLSLQVHPPSRAKHLGEPKTEMWYIADADAGAELFVGLKSGVTREIFERAVAHGRVAECFHRISVHSGDTMFLPSGRVHAIGGGLVIFEIQQNSDTTFRVHDWDRLGLDGKPRELHVSQSLASIDFDDVEPALTSVTPARVGVFEVSVLVDHPLFSARMVHAVAAGQWLPAAAQLQVLACVSGSVAVVWDSSAQTLRPGDFCLVPATLSETAVASSAGARFLAVAAGT